MYACRSEYVERVLGCLVRVSQRRCESLVHDRKPKKVKVTPAFLERGKENESKYYVRKICVCLVSVEELNLYFTIKHTKVT